MSRVVRKEILNKYINLGQISDLEFELVILDRLSLCQVSSFNLDNSIGQTSIET